MQQKERASITDVQEAMRRDVERAFGVLMSRWELLERPCASWDSAFSGEMTKDPIILYNIIVSARRDGYESVIW